MLKAYLKHTLNKNVNSWHFQIPYTSEIANITWPQLAALLRAE